MSARPSRLADQDGSGPGQGRLELGQSTLTSTFVFRGRWEASRSSHFQRLDFKFFQSASQEPRTQVQLENFQNDEHESAGCQRQRQIVAVQRAETK